MVIDVSFDRQKIINMSDYKYLFHINDGGIECSDNNCIFSYPLVNDFTLDLYSKNNIYLQTLNLTSPILKIDATKDSYLN